MCQGQNAVRHLRNEYKHLLDTYSVLIMPTVPRVADKFPCEDAKIKGRSIATFQHLMGSSDIASVKILFTTVSWALESN